MGFRGHQSCGDGSTILASCVFTRGRVFVSVRINSEHAKHTQGKGTAHPSPSLQLHACRGHDLYRAYFCKQIAAPAWRGGREKERGRYTYRTRERELRIKKLLREGKGREGDREYGFLYRLKYIPAYMILA